MSTLLVKNASTLITMDSQRQIIENGGIYVNNNVIEQIGKTCDLPKEADSVIDASDMIILPGMVNTHHHFYQTLTRAVPGAEDAKLFDWLVRLYPIWGEMDKEAVYVSTKTAMAELILSGCTTSSDHLYLYPNDATFDDQIRAAKEIGMRFHPTRGSMSLGRSKGGLPPDHVVQDEDEILKDYQKAIEDFHDPSPYSMVRVTLAPCSPFSVTGDAMKEAAKLARSYKKVQLHTHVAETKDEETFTMEKFGLRPARYMESLGWVGNDVWWAHAIHLNDEEIKLLANTGTGVAHCPSSNMRLGSGICKVREMLDAGVKVSLAVDGSASNDSSNLFEEARHCPASSESTRWSECTNSSRGFGNRNFGRCCCSWSRGYRLSRTRKSGRFYWCKCKSTQLEWWRCSQSSCCTATLLCKSYRLISNKWKDYRGKWQALND